MNFFFREVEIRNLTLKVLPSIKIDKIGFKDLYHSLVKGLNYLLNYFSEMGVPLRSQG